jgi:hypothetical protein
MNKRKAEEKLKTMNNPTAFGKLVSMMVVGLFVVGALSVRPQPLYAQAEFRDSDVVIFATSSIQIDKRTEIQSGGVVANDSSLVTIEPGFELDIRRDAKIFGEVKANRMKVGPGVTLSGTVECNASLDVTCSGLAPLPVLIVPPFDEANVPPEAEDVVVDTGGTVELNAGDYADIEIKKNGTLIFLDGGVHNIGSIVGRVNARIEFQMPTELRILGTLALGKAGFLGPGDNPEDVRNSVETSGPPGPLVYAARA